MQAKQGLCFDSKAAVMLLLIICLLLLPLFCGGFLFGPCFVVQYLVSFLVFQSHFWGRASWMLYFNCLLMSCDCWCIVSLPHDATSWSAV